MDSDDQGLLERIQNGDGESFAVLYDRTRRWLLTFVIRPRVGQADAEDVLAETFQFAAASIAQFRWKGVGLLHWLAAIARRKALEHARKRSRVPEALEELPALMDLPGDGPTAEAEMIRRETVQEVRERVGGTLGRLPPRYAEALRLRLLEERNRQQCADALGVSVATFDVILHRATRAFHREWSRP